MRTAEHEPVELTEPDHECILPYQIVGGEVLPHELESGHVYAVYDHAYSHLTVKQYEAGLFDMPGGRTDRHRFQGVDPWTREPSRFGSPERGPANILTESLDSIPVLVSVWEVERLGDFPTERECRSVSRRECETEIESFLYDFSRWKEIPEGEEMQRHALDLLRDSIAERKGACDPEELLANLVRELRDTGGGGLALERAKRHLWETEQRDACLP